jgi:hypothetical protein
MRLYSWPVAVEWSVLRPTTWSDVIGAGRSESLARFAQVVSAPTSLVGFEMVFPPMRGATARAFDGLIGMFAGGANAVRLVFRDGREPDRAEFGLSGESWGEFIWTEGYAWTGGVKWAGSPPRAALTAAASRGAVDLVVDATTWPVSLLGLRFGCVGHYGVYRVLDVAMSGNLATLRIWPSLRRSVEAGTLLTFRPAVAVTVANATAGSYRDEISWRSDGVLDLIEVEDAVIRRYAA